MKYLAVGMNLVIQTFFFFSILLKTLMLTLTSRKFLCVFCLFVCVHF